MNATNEIRKIKLVLKDGSVFYGNAFGARRSCAGEVVFNTGMVGYPDALTDPSYRGQILVLTYPIIGNYGIPSDQAVDGLSKHFESNRIQVRGLVVSDCCEEYNHWNAKMSLPQWLSKHNVPGISGIDTRELTKRLRKKGTMLGKIIYEEDVPFDDPGTKDLVAKVTIRKPLMYGNGKTRIVAVDCGIKHNIIRCFLKRNVTVIRVPADYDFHKVKCDGIFISNGPGDPKMCKKTIANLKKAMGLGLPIFGICLGNQLLGLAAGGDTYKLKYGHRGQNQPCIEVGTCLCYITSQNHGYALAKELPPGWRPWFVNANDGTIEGIRHKSKPFMSVQFHPEAKPGPVDTEFLFDEFLNMIRSHKCRRT